MKLDKSLEPFRATIEALNNLLQKVNQRGVIIGGVAVGFWLMCKGSALKW